MRLAQLAAAIDCTVLLSLNACNDASGPGGGGGALEITSVTPAAGASNVEALVTVAAVFNQGINPATLTTTTFRLKYNGAPIPTGLLWDGPAQTGRAPAALLPGQAYEVEVSTGVQTPGGSSLATPEVWSFTTRPWQAVTVGAEAVLATSLAREANGRLHVAYEADGGAGFPVLKYATCATACEAAANWLVVAVDTPSWAGESPSVAVDGAGRVHIAYGAFANPGNSFDFKYATCATACTVAANWQTVVADTGSAVLADQGFLWYSLAVGAGGRVHVSYYDDTQPQDVKYGTCAAACSTAANWQIVTLDTARTGPGALALDGSGRVHVIYSKVVSADRYLAYGTCPAGCGTLASWQVGELPIPLGGVPAVAAERGGQVHVVFEIGNFPAAAGFGYAQCVASCTVGTNWVWGTVDPGIDGRGALVGVDTTRRVHVTYENAGTNELRYSTCVVNCAVGTLPWRSAIVDSGAAAMYESLEVGTDGRLHVAYRSSSAGVGFRYIQ